MRLNLTTEQQEIVIRKGQALEAKAPKSINLSGTLQAPAQWLEGKLSVLDPVKCHIIIKKDEGSIKLAINDTDAYTTTEITGSLSRDKQLQLFAINTERRWTIQEFLKFIKTMRYYFADKAAHSALVESIQKWSVKIERVIVEHNDNKGNSNFQLETKVQAVDGLIQRFDLSIPLFQGYQKVKFTVEIGLDPKNTAVSIYLFSDELIELEIIQRESILNDELKKFDDFKCAKVVVS
jgi:hypothetical protein